MLRFLRTIFEPPEDASGPPIIYAGPFFRALFAPIIMWSCLVALAILGKAPGVVCVTPMAWLLALWSGARYVILCNGRPGRYPLIGPALLGGLIGLGEGSIYIVVMVILFPLSLPEDIAKGNIFTAMIVIGGVLVCSFLSSFIALVSLRRYSKIYGGKN